MLTSRKGFTIVELLIVIVVIAVLAAISVVAFNGIQQRAKAASYVTALNQWQKLLAMSKEITGSYPSTGGFEACLSASYPASDGYSANQCFRSSVSYTVSTSSTITNAISSANTTVPTTILPSIATVDNANGSQGWGRGLIYSYSGSGQAYIQYYVDKSTANGACISNDTVEYNNYADGTVRCRRYFN